MDAGYLKRANSESLENESYQKKNMIFVYALQLRKLSLTARRTDLGRTHSQGVRVRLPETSFINTRGRLRSEGQLARC